MYFEESSAYQAELAKEARSHNHNDDGMQVDSVVGGDDEVDIFEARKRARQDVRRR